MASGSSDGFGLVKVSRCLCNVITRASPHRVETFHAGPSRRGVSATPRVLADVPGPPRKGLPFETIVHLDRSAWHGRPPDRTPAESAVLCWTWLDRPSTCARFAGQCPTGRITDSRLDPTRPRTRDSSLGRTLLTGSGTAAGTCDPLGSSTSNWRGADGRIGGRCFLAHLTPDGTNSNLRGPAPTTP
jgi:hypothetical protein